MMVKKIITYNLILFFILALGCTKKIYTENILFGSWITFVNEPVDGKCTIEVVWNPDHTTDVLFIYENGNKLKLNTKWSYNNGLYDETFSDGSKGKAKINWINKNKFELIIIENQDTKNYKGRIRVFERKK